MFNPAKLNDDNKKILAAFYNKRKLFDTYIKENGLQIFTCPGCGYPTLNERGGYEICSICNWEDDGQDDRDADKILGGPNKNISLTENRITIGRILSENANSLKTTINLDPSYLLSVFKDYENKKEEIESRMTGNETPGHPIWREWERAKKELLSALYHNTQ
jgi:uncharacterized Zn finger protein (UPF0148 family)